MIVIDNKEKCCGCSACKAVCRKNAISMQADEEGFLYPHINMQLCVNCSMCEKVCPILNPVKRDYKEIKINAYAGYHSDEIVVKQSSSGGIFSALAEFILEKGGVVVGATMSEDCSHVYHTFIEKIDEISLLRGSKYIQSEIRDTYSLVQEALVADKTVLFTGTPCQVEGLKSFLQKDYSKLYCVDFICHGVPSPLIWKHYLSWREQQYHSSVNKVQFRNKKHGWNNYSMVLTFENGKEYFSKFDRDIFMKCFLSDLILRPSCYNCSFKGLHRLSDITIADFWGCDRVCPEMNNLGGTSLVVVNSFKGRDILKKISSNIILREIDIDDAIWWNKSILYSAKKPTNREQLIGNINMIVTPKLWKNILPKESWSSRFKKIIPRKIKECIKKKLLN